MTTDMQSETENKKKSGGQAFDAQRVTAWAFDPIKDLCIVGGQQAFEGTQEEGEADTGDGPEHALWDRRILEPLDEEYIKSVDAFGVIEPPQVCKLNGQAVVVNGRRRVRAARIVNRRREKRGEPLLKVECKLVRADEIGMTARMIATNEARVDDPLLVKIEKLKKLLGRGVSIEDAAVAFCRPLAEIETWLAFDDHATVETRKALESGKISASAAIVVAQVTDSAKQKGVLTEVLDTGTGKATTLKATRAKKKVTRAPGDKGGDGLQGKKEIRQILAALGKVEFKKTQGYTKAGQEFIEGFEAALTLVTGDEIDSRVKQILKDVRKDAK